VRRFPIRERHGLDSVSIPSLRIKGPQEEPEPASDVQHRSFAAEAIEKTRAVALIAADPLRICGLDSAPIFLSVIRLELSRRKLRLGPDQTTGGTAPEKKWPGRARPVNSLLQDRLCIPRAAERTGQPLRGRCTHFFVGICVSVRLQFLGGFARLRMDARGKL